MSKRHDDTAFTALVLGAVLPTPADEDMACTPEPITRLHASLLKQSHTPRPAPILFPVTQRLSTRLH